jgi:hypothetical protein
MFILSLATAQQLDLSQFYLSQSQCPSAPIASLLDRADILLDLSII